MQLPNPQNSQKDRKLFHMDPKQPKRSSIFETKEQKQGNNQKNATKRCTITKENEQNWIRVEK